MTGPEVCALVGLQPSQVRALVERDVVAPSGGGGGQRGQQHRWNAKDVPVLMIVKRLLDASAPPDTARRVVRHLHTIKRASIGSMLVVGPTTGPTIVSPERLARTIINAGEAVHVLDLELVRRSLRERGVQW